MTTSQKYNCGLCFFAPVTHSNGQWETLQWVQKVISVGCNYRDANLWRPKIGRLYFFYSPPEFQRPPPPGMGMTEALYDVSHDVHTIEIRMLEKIFVNDKNAPETILRIRKIQVLS